MNRHLTDLPFPPSDDLDPAMGIAAAVCIGAVSWLAIIAVLVMVALR